MCAICVHSNYQLHTCGSRTRVTEIISRELPTLECIFVPRCSCNRLTDNTPLFTDADSPVRSLFVHLSVEILMKMIERHLDGNLATAAKASVLP